MNEKKFIVVVCEELDDQYECDAYRTIYTNFYGQKQIQMLLESKVYRIPYDYESYGSKEDAKQALLDSLDEEDFKLFGKNLESKIENYICEYDLIKFECYEITENGLKFRQDLSNYNR